MHLLSQDVREKVRNKTKQKNNQNKKARKRYIDYLQPLLNLLLYPLTQSADPGLYTDLFLSISPDKAALNECVSILHSLFVKATHLLILEFLGQFPAACHIPTWAGTHEFSESVYPSCFCIQRQTLLVLGFEGLWNREAQESSNE